MIETRAPAITVVISTRNRSDAVLMALRGVLANDYPNFELIIVDQSDDDRTANAVQPFLADPRLRYVRSSTTGITGGRNRGIALARSDLIVMTDDDCEIPKNWLREFAQAFALDPNIGVVYGSVLPVAHDPATGFVVSYVRNGPMLARSMREKHLVEGAAACMGMRLSVWKTLGGFDEMLGIGSPLKAAEEKDFSIRALLAGFYVFETPRIAVTHHSFVAWEDRKQVIGRYLYGNGATLAKHLKCAHGRVVWYFLRSAWQSAYGRPEVAVEFGARGRTIYKLVCFAQGFFAGLVRPLERSRCHYAYRPARLAAPRRHES
jgi:GT2 family glycosyltransferase